MMADYEIRNYNSAIALSILCSLISKTNIFYNLLIFIGYTMVFHSILANEKQKSINELKNIKIYEK